MKTKNILIGVSIWLKLDITGGCNLRNGKKCISINNTKYTKQIYNNDVDYCTGDRTACNKG